MLPDGAIPFHSHPGVMVDDQGHPHDVVQLVEEVPTHTNEEVDGKSNGVRKDE